MVPSGALRSQRRRSGSNSCKAQFRHCAAHGISTKIRSPFANTDPSITFALSPDSFVSHNNPRASQPGPFVISYLRFPIIIAIIYNQNAQSSSRTPAFPQRRNTRSSSRRAAPGQKRRACRGLSWDPPGAGGRVVPGLLVSVRGQPERSPPRFWPGSAYPGSMLQV